jgi:hypothetical protein
MDENSYGHFAVETQADEFRMFFVDVRHYQRLKDYSHAAGQFDNEYIK